LWNEEALVNSRARSASLGVGVIGLGIGAEHARGVALDGRCRLEVICDEDPEILRMVSLDLPNTPTTTDPRAVLDNPEVSLVCVATFDESHAALVIGALDRGKDVFVEKPICVSSEELRAIQVAMQRNPNCRVSSNLILRRAPRFIELKRRIDSGELGRLYFNGRFSLGCSVEVLLLCRPK